jgi:hypothetical protein
MVFQSRAEKTTDYVVVFVMTKSLQLGHGLELTCHQENVAADHFPSVVRSKSSTLSAGFTSR